MTHQITMRGERHTQKYKTQKHTRTHKKEKKSSPNIIYGTNDL
jgi:hypothetical protein